MWQGGLMRKLGNENPNSNTNLQNTFETIAQKGKKIVMLTRNIELNSNNK